MSAERVLVVRDVLRSHGYRGSSSSCWCTCGDVEPVTTNRRERPNVANLHRIHVAELVVAALAEHGASPSG